MSFVPKCALVALMLAAGTAAAQRQPVKLPPRPEVPPAKPYTYPKVTIDSLPNGLRFAIVENHELPLVVVRTAIAGAGPGGIWHLDPPGKPGAFGLMLATLREATTSRPTAQLRDEILDIGADMFFTNSVSFTPPNFRAPRSRWIPALTLMADVIRNATLPADGLARVQTSLAGALDRLPPITHSNRGVWMALYGAESPNSQFPTSASIRSVTRDDIVALKDKYLRPQNTTIVIVGDVTVADARDAVAIAFGGWERGGTTVTSIAPPTPVAAPTAIYLKDSPGLAQTFVAAGFALPGRDHADTPAIEALSALVGDAGFAAGSRLYTAFRAERGLSYAIGVTQTTRPIPETAPLIATLTVTPASVDTAVVLMRRVLGDLQGARPPSQSELEFAKRGLIGRAPAEMERLDVVASNVASSILDRLPPKYLESWAGRINAITLPEVQAAAAKYIDPDHMAIVVVGDRSKIEAPLRATGIPVVIIEK